MSVSVVKPSVKLRQQEDQEMSDCLQVKLVLNGARRCKSQRSATGAQDAGELPRVQVRDEKAARERAKLEARMGDENRKKEEEEDEEDEDEDEEENDDDDANVNQEAEKMVEEDAVGMKKRPKMQKMKKLTQDQQQTQRTRRECKQSKRREQEKEDTDEDVDDETGKGEVLNVIGGSASRKEECRRPAADPAARANLTKAGQSRLVASLHAAASEGKVELVRLLLRCGAQVNSQDEQFANTALHQAAWNGFSQTVEVLCKYRANTSIKNKAQFTPLHLACQQGHNQSARLLLMANAKSGAKNSYGDTPLHTAARYGHAGVARILLSAKCDPNQLNMNHDTPLHIAAAMGRRKLTKILMQSGVEVAIKNKTERIMSEPRSKFEQQGETAMDIALRKHLIDIQELIANPPAEHKSCHAKSYQSGQMYASARRRLPPEGSARRLGALELAVDVPGEPALGAKPNQLVRAKCLAPDARSPSPAGRKLSARSSPTGSARSSLSRSRGRLVRANRRKSLADLDQQAAKQALKRPNLGTCVGKLSLLRLRQLAQGGRQRAKSQEQLEPADKQQQVNGRRQLRQQQAVQLRAPNGTQLLVSRPLASLADESQLYAIPRKSKSKAAAAAAAQPASAVAANQQQVASEEPDGQQERTNSRGPALTSDGGHTSSSAASSASGRAERDALGELVCVGRPGGLAGVRAGRKSPAEPACTCACDQLPADQRTANSSQEPAGSRLRQLLHLESAKPAPALSAIAAGYYAYSPVVQTSSEASVQLADQPDVAESQAKSSKRFWLMSKLSLSSHNINAAAKPERLNVEPVRSPELISVHEQPQEDRQGRLSRPKSAMSALTSDLMAAQKSLAAAAAAKVRRDRLVRLAAATRPSSASRNLLTVKTQPTPADWLEHPTLIGESSQSATRYSMGLHHRPASGTNSAGMSDSSPSNNGADSDNSTQTTGSLGILSRILLNSKNCQRTNANQSSKTSNQVGAAEQVSVCSSLSSPSTTNGSSQQQSSPSLLEQLGGSRSRRPIVAGHLTDSDDSTLVAPLQQQQHEHQLGSHSTPSDQPTPKSALKTARNSQPARTIRAAHEAPTEPLNGLPRVSSYTQLSSEYKQAPLCDYHALASGQQLHLQQQQQPSQGRPLYPAHNFYSSYGAQAMLLAGASNHQHHLSQHDLRSQSSGITNYDYYLDSSGYQASLAQMHAAYQANMHAIPPYESHIYIPPYLGAASQLQPVDSPPSADTYQESRPKSSLDNLLLRSQSNHNIERNLHPADQRAAMVSLQYPAAGFANADIYSRLPTSTGASFRLANGAGTGLTVLPANSEPQSSSITPRAPSAEGGLARESPLASTGVDQRTREEIECQSAGRAKVAARPESKSARGNSWMPSAGSTTSTNVYKSLVRVNQPSLNNKSNQSSSLHQPLESQEDAEQTKPFSSNLACQQREAEVGQENRQPASQVVLVSSKLEQAINRAHLLEVSQQQSKQTNNANRCAGVKDCSTTTGSLAPARKQTLLINNGDNRAPLRSMSQQEQAKDRNSIESAANSSDSWSSPGSHANNEEAGSPPIHCVEDGASTVL